MTRRRKLWAWLRAALRHMALVIAVIVVILNWFHIWNYTFWPQLARDFNPLFSLLIQFPLVASLLFVQVRGETLARNDLPARVKLRRSLLRVGCVVAGAILLFCLLDPIVLGARARIALAGGHKALAAEAKEIGAESGDITSNTIHPVDATATPVLRRLRPHNADIAEADGQTTLYLHFLPLKDGYSYGLAVHDGPLVIPWETRSEWTKELYSGCTLWCADF